MKGECIILLMVDGTNKPLHCMQTTGQLFQLIMWNCDFSCKLFGVDINRYKYKFHFKKGFQRSYSTYLKIYLVITKQQQTALCFSSPPPLPQPHNPSKKKITHTLKKCFRIICFFVGKVAKIFQLILLSSLVTTLKDFFELLTLYLRLNDH